MIPWFLDHLRAHALHYNKKNWEKIGSGEQMGKIIILVFDMLVWRNFETVKL